MHMKKLKLKLKKLQRKLKKTHARRNKRSYKATCSMDTPSSLDAPPAPDGFRHRWIRAESFGFDDTKNISGKLRSGYTLVMASEYKDSDYPVVQDGKHKGVIGVGGLLLARIPDEIAEARQKYYSEKAAERDDAVKNDLLKDQHPSMPITVDRRSSKSFGGK